MKTRSAKRPLVHIYTDGACEGNPGPGGWAAVMRFGRNTKELWGSEPHTTNNRMELQAAISALQSLKRPCQVHLYTDSEYLRRGVTQWLPDWVCRGWRTSQKRPVKNQELWKTLYRLTQIHEIEWHWVKGHAGDPLNERVDLLARRAIRRPRPSVHAPGAIHLYIKSSCCGARGPGGWAVVCTHNNKTRELSGAEPNTTANRMEIRAAIEGLRACERDRPVHIYTTNRYLFDGATRWMANWIARGWKTHDGRPVRNKDLWVRLNEAMEGREIQWHLLKQTPRPPESKRASILARQAARGSQ